MLFRSGVGKSTLACALAHQACRQDFAVRYFRMPQLNEELLRAGAQHKKSALITSQMPVDAWHTHLDDPTLADAILDRLVHNAYQLELTGESMRKRKPLERPGKT